VTLSIRKGETRMLNKIIYNGKNVALLLIAYATGLWLGETLPLNLFPDGTRSHKLFSGLFVFLNTHTYSIQV
jgi:hypothetical protein